MPKRDAGAAQSGGDGGGEEGAAGDESSGQDGESKGADEVLAGLLDAQRFHASRNRRRQKSIDLDLNVNVSAVLQTC